MSMSAREELLKNPDIEQLITSAPAIGDAVRLGVTKPSMGFREVMKNIKRRNPHSTIHDR